MVVSNNLLNDMNWSTAMRATINEYIGRIFRFKKNEMSKRYISRLLKENNPIFLEVGAGNKREKNEWITLDMTENCDIYWDLRKGIPFPGESISKMYSSHFLEHLSFREGQVFLKECLRVLVPGGSFSICVPNSRIYIEAYYLNKTLDPHQFFAYKPAFNNTTKIDYINHIAYMDGEHKYMFDEDNLACILMQSGFRNVRLRKFDSNIDLESRDLNSIYAEAEK